MENGQVGVNVQRSLLTVLRVDNRVKSAHKTPEIMVGPNAYSIAPKLQ